MHITEADALRTYPELAKLIDLRRSGWRFAHWIEDNVQLGITGSHSVREFTDALFIADRTTVLAVRMLADQPGARGGLIWKYHGALTDAVDELLTLPRPGEPGAPSLIISGGSLDI
jgi:hypothetical protein